MLRRLLLSLSMIGVASCDPSTSIDVDAGVEAGVDASVRDAGPAPVWPRDLPDLASLGDRRGRRLARTIVHVHSPLSHDACDGAGFEGGALADPECLAHFRDAACTLRMDALMITDHAPHVDEVSFASALWIQGDDEPVRDVEGRVIASRMACPDGRRVLLTAGSENEMMPVGLLRHPGDTTEPAVLSSLYEADGAAAADVFRAAGALTFYAHTEGHPLEQLRATHPDGVEIYNTHANVDPDIRRDFLGLEPLDYAPLLLRFTVASNRLAPDLSFLSFFSENTTALARWDTLLAEGWHLTGTGGCDAHENTFTSLMPDGERGDSYRRMMRWHTHHVLVDAMDRDGVMDALRAGRLYLAFEVFGTPIGFDFVAETDGGAIAEMGDESVVGATLRVVRPSLPEGFPADPAPTLRMRILRAADGGAVEVAAGDGDTLQHVVTEPGAYRAEVRMVPEHARPYLGRFADELIREVVWIYSNPIYAD